MRKVLLIFAGLAALPVIGCLVAVRLTDDGIDAFRDDPVAYRVARAAYSLAWVHHDNPLQRLLTPVARVVTVRQVGDRCPQAGAWPGFAAATMIRPGSPAIARGPAAPYAELAREYVAQLRFYTLFGFPAADLYFSCGSVSSTQPASWG